MKSPADGRCRRQISFLRRQSLQDDRLPFGDVLSAKTLSAALATIEGGWVDRTYTPVVTLWVFLGQYPLTHNQKEGLPLARVAAITSLSFDLTTGCMPGRAKVR